MLQNILSKFTRGGNLFDACASLLAYLNVQFDRQSEEPINIANIYNDALPKYLTEALTYVSHTYFMGVVNDLSLKGKAEAQQLVDHIAIAEAEQDKYSGMFLFAIDVKDGCELTRTHLNALTRALNRISVANPVTLFVREGHLLSISSCERMNFAQEWRQGEKLGKVSVLHHVDCQSPHRGHLDIISELDATKFRSFDALYAQWLKVFNTTILTKKFYEDLFSWYEWAVAEDSGITFDTTVPDKWKEKRGMKIIRLITRLLFVWFIKQKGLVPDKIFEIDSLKSILKDFDPNSENQGSFYWAILQNLFFATLNHPIIDDGEKRGFTSKKGQDVKNIYRYENEFSISKEEVVALFSKVPFLNCGLFDCQDKCKTIDGKDCNYYNDGFTRNDVKDKDGHFKHRAFIPNIFFFHKEWGLISIFQRYIFTVEENTPQDEQVALDPELLGKVFENLLGFYNEETHNTARKESGSFYTPREIVQYMVNESLIAHLKRVVGADLEPQYRQLLDYTTEDIDLSPEQKRAIMQALITCKILDPACGSGAFPMGMLQQMVHILQQVDPNNSGWRSVLTNLVTEDTRRAFNIENEEERKNKLREIEGSFDNSIKCPDYTRKLYLIESCIYGVDIQPIAMLITRLRFFITLVCEQKDIRWDDPEHNYGIQTLPNLESKFVAANSLLDADIHKYSNDWTNNEALLRLKNELLAIRKEHFYTRKYSKKIRLLRADEEKCSQIRALIMKLVGEPNNEEISLQLKLIDNYERELQQYEGENWVDATAQTNLFADAKPIRYDKNKLMRDKLNQYIINCRKAVMREIDKTTPTGFEQAVLQITEWNPYDQTTVSPFLDIEWMFGITDGFDIVIGNPPYIQLQNNDGALAKLYADCGYKTFARTGDIYCLFYERGYQLLKQGGHLCYITSNKWMRAGYGEKTRDFFVKNTNPLLLIDFAGVKIFESATVDTNILLFAKAANAHKTLCAVTNKQNKDKVKILSDFVQQSGTICDFTNSDSWVILSPIEQSIKRKIEAVGTPLKDWDIEINYGIKTGCNDAFIISTEKRNEILANCQTEDERKRTEKIIRPILRGRDIKRYGYNWAGLWLIATFPACHYDIENYPAVKKYLLEFGIERLEQTGKSHIVNGEKIKARKKTNNKWFETQDSISYWEDFDKPKIVYMEIQTDNPNEGYPFPCFSYDDSGSVVLNTAYIMCSNSVDIRYVLGVLNSSVGRMIARFYVTQLQERQYRMLAQYLSKFPIVKSTTAVQYEVAARVQKCLDSSSVLDEDYINVLVYHLYGFNYDEVLVIDPKISISREEYETGGV